MLMAVKAYILFPMAVMTVKDLNRMEDHIREHAGNYNDFKGRFGWPGNDPKGH